MKSCLRLLATLFAAVSVLSFITSCSEKEEPVVDNGLVQVSVEAIKGYQDGDEATRALIEESGTDWIRIIATWEEGDEVYVYKQNYNAATPAQFLERVGVLKAKNDGQSAIRHSGYSYPVEKTLLVGELDGSLLGNGATLFFSYKHPVESGFSFTGQKGTLKDIDDNYDYATTTAGVSVRGSGINFSRWLEFQSAQSIVRFALKDQDGNPLTARKLVIRETPYPTVPSWESEGGHIVEADIMTMYDLQDMFAYHKQYEYADPWYSMYNGYHYLNPDHLGAIEVNPASPTDVFYVALRGNWGNSGMDCGFIEITATVGSDTYYLKHELGPGQLIWNNEFENLEVWLTKQTTSD